MEKKIKSCFICWKHFSSPYHSIFTPILHFTPVLNRCLPPLLSRQCFFWCKVNYVSVSFPFCGCCLTRSTKLNTRSGCPLYNLASNSKDFPESLAKLLGMIFLYFGTPLTCCRYLVFLFLNDVITRNVHYCGQFVRLVSPLCQSETFVPLWRRCIFDKYCMNNILLIIFKSIYSCTLPAWTFT